MSRSRLIGDLAKSLDSSAVGTFLSKGASDGNFRSILYGDLSGAPTALDSSLSSQLVDSAYVQLRQTSVGGGSGLDSAQTIAILDSNYMANRGGYPGLGIYHFDATAGQTVFQESDASGSVLSYTENGIIVFYNGVRLPKADYTATDGTSVTLVDSADSADVISIVKWGLGGNGASLGFFGDRAVIACRFDNGGGTDDMSYYDITTPGNASDFGDLTRTATNPGALSDTTYGVFAGGGSPYQNVIDYVTIASPGNATDFGDLSYSPQDPGTASNGTYGLVAGGYTGGATTNIDYITIASPGNATDFGDLVASARNKSGCGGETYGLFCGMTNASSAAMDYVTISTPGNASDFGDMTIARWLLASAANNTYGLNAGGLNSDGNGINNIDYITFDTPGNATDFGDLTITRYLLFAAANATTATMGGGNYPSSVKSIDYVTIDTPGNAADFGDMNLNWYRGGGCSGSPS